VRSATLALLLLVSAPAPGGAEEDAVARWAEGRPELRFGVPHARWVLDPAAQWGLRRGCVERLEGVQVERLGWSPTPAPEPVRVVGAVNGVRFVKRRAGAPLLVACELATRLPVLADVFRAHGIERVEVMSALRREPEVSYHHLGLALDLTRFWGDEGELSVERDYRPHPGEPTCEDVPEDAALRKLACDLHATRALSTVLTPSYGRGHGNHFHVDTRPDDPWRYVR